MTAALGTGITVAAWVLAAVLATILASVPAIGIVRTPVGIVFAALVVELQALLAPVIQRSTIAVAGSTLVASALFQPVRRRVQRAVDQRFNRTGARAGRAVEAFAGHLRDELDLDALRDRVLETSTEVAQPRTSAIWLRPRART